MAGTVNYCELKCFPNIPLRQRLFDARYFWFYPMEEFFSNVSRYPRYLISFTFGIFYNAIAPLVPLLKKPATAIALVSAVVAAFVGLTFTLQAMLGLS
jgi:hypothetical protein